MKRLVLVLALLPTVAFAEDIPLSTTPAPSSPMPMMQNAVGNLYGQLATTQAALSDAQARIKQLEQQLKDKSPPKPEGESKP